MTDCTSETCITCGDVAVAMKVIEVDEARCLALCESAASRDSLANPEALDWFVELAQKRSDPS